MNGGEEGMWNKLWMRLANERGQLQLPGLGSFGSTLTQFLPSIGSYLTNLTSNPTTTGLPRLAEQAGGAALLGYAMRPQEDITVPSIYDFRSPYGTSAVNYLQGLYQAPADPFAPSGIYSKYLPQLQSAETDLFNDIQQRLIAGQPGSLSTVMGGPEIAAIREGFLTRALPQRLALQADLMREAMTRQQQAAGTVYGGEGNLQQLAFASEVEAALANARTESERNAILGALGTALLLSGRGGPTAGTTGIPGAGQPGAAQGGTLADQISRYLGGAGTAGMGQYAPIGQMSVADILGQMQAGTLTTQQGLALLSRSLPGVIAAGTGGYGAGSAVGGYIGEQTDSQALGALSGAASGAAAGAVIGSVIPGVGTAIGAVVGGLAGLFGGLGETREGQQAVKQLNLETDLASQADQVQTISQFFINRIAALGGDVTQLAQRAQSLMDTSGSSADEQSVAAQEFGSALLRQLQSVNPTITSLSQVPGLRQEFIDWLIGETYVEPASGERSAYDPYGRESGGTQQWIGLAGLARGGSIPSGGEFIVGERGPELLRAAPGSEVLPMVRGPDGAYGFDLASAQRPVLPFLPPAPRFAIPDVSRALEGPPANFGQALIAGFDPLALAPGALPALISGLRASGGYPGTVALDSPRLGPIPPQRPPVALGRRPAFAGASPAGPQGQSLLARALQVQRTPRRRRNAPAYV